MALPNRIILPPRFQGTKENCVSSCSSGTTSPRLWQTAINLGLSTVDGGLLTAVGYWLIATSYRPSATGSQPVYRHSRTNSQAIFWNADILSIATPEP